MIDFINVNKFSDIANYVINLIDGQTWNNNILKQNAIIFCHPNDLDLLFSNIRYSRS